MHKYAKKSVRRERENLEGRKKTINEIHNFLNIKYDKIAAKHCCFPPFSFARGEYIVKGKLELKSQLFCLCGWLLSRSTAARLNEFLGKYYLL